MQVLLETVVHMLFAPGFITINCGLTEIMKQFVFYSPSTFLFNDNNNVCCIDLLRAYLINLKTVRIKAGQFNLVTDM
jgi:hypothetical protein